MSAADIRAVRILSLAVSDLELAVAYAGQAHSELRRWPMSLQRPVLACTVYRRSDTRRLSVSRSGSGKCSYPATGGHSPRLLAKFGRLDRCGRDEIIIEPRATVAWATIA